MFQPECTSALSVPPNTTSSGIVVFDLRDPFYTSISPQIYAIATATVTSYMLVVMLFITPRTFFIGDVGGGSGFLGRRGLISGASGSASVVGIGGRPWLQKVATLTVAISLTVATVKTFEVTEQQYDSGFQDTTMLTDRVVGALEIRVIRVISDTFLWLAQVQTLIRLFPRHKEKVIIKWIGFALIILDTIFSILNSFISTHGRPRSRRFVDAVPALSYLFQLALSLLYAAWVIYYSFEKRRFAFFHPKMRNIGLVAILSLAAVLMPVTFFVLDISKPDVARWGDYVRWVGAAAASVVVWEWVERIEALERDERKEGILGREIFDGDEMLDVTPSSEVNWPRNQRDRGGGPGGDRQVNTTGRSGASKAISATEQTLRSRVPPRYVEHARRENGTIATVGHGSFMSGGAGPRTLLYQHHLTVPLPVASPISRTDTTSAASTVYAVRYDTISTSTSPSPDLSIVRSREYTNDGPPSTPPPPTVSSAVDSVTDEKTEQQGTSNTSPFLTDVVSAPRWQNLVPNPFKRRRTSPPPEVAHATQRLASNSSPMSTSYARPKISARTSNIAHRLRARRHAGASETILPMVIIPAQPRGRAYKPSDPAVEIGRAAQSDGNALEVTWNRSAGDSERALSSVQHTQSPSLEVSSNETIATQPGIQMMSEDCQPHNHLWGTDAIYRPLGQHGPAAPLPDPRLEATDESTTTPLREASNPPRPQHSYPVRPLPTRPTTNNGLESRRPP